jgi:hypothetical protein
MIYLGRWVWHDSKTEFGPCWMPPAGAAEALDLRPLHAHTSGGEAEGWGLFDIPGPQQVSPILFPLAPTMNSFVANRDRARLANAFGLIPEGTEKLGDYVFRALTIDRDVNDEKMCLGLMPSKANRIVFSFADYKRNQGFHPGDEVLWPGIQYQLQQAYREARDQSIKETAGTKGDHYLKVLDFWKEQYKIDEALLIPGDLPVEQSVKHNTTHTESFNKADSSTIGPDLTWTAITAGGSWNILSNKLRENAAAADPRFIRAEADVSSADHYGQIISTAGTTSNLNYALARYSAIAATHYGYLWRPSDGVNQVVSVIAGVVSVLTTGTATTSSYPVTLQCNANGTTIKGYINGVEKASVTSAAIATGTRSGVGCRTQPAATADFDSYEVSDLGGGGSPVGPLIRPKLVFGGILLGGRLK